MRKYSTHTFLGWENYLSPYRGSETNHPPCLNHCPGDIDGWIGLLPSIPQSCVAPLHVRANSGISSFVTVTHQGQTPTSGSTSFNLAGSNKVNTTQSSVAPRGELWLCRTKSECEGTKSPGLLAHLFLIMEMSLATMAGHSRAWKEDKDAFICGRDENKQRWEGRWVLEVSHLLLVSQKLWD